jgi:LPS sulfotransferase NodH
VTANLPNSLAEVPMDNRGLGVPDPGPFEGVEFDAEKYKAMTVRPAAKLRYTIFFTARSGSTYLMSAIEQEGSLGRPSEYFNPKQMVPRVRKFGATNIEQYVDILLRRPKFVVAFGAEMTFPQLKRVFGHPQRFFELVAPQKTFWLIRRDIVAQALSLVKMKQSGVSHSPNSKPDEIAAAEAKLSYDPQAIKHRVIQFVGQEERTENLIQAKGLEPLRMTYEHNIEMGPEALRKRFFGHLGLLPKEVAERPPYEKLAGSSSAEIVERFRKDEAAFMREIDKRREAFLSRFP